MSKKKARKKPAPQPRHRATDPARDYRVGLRDGGKLTYRGGSILDAKLRMMGKRVAGIKAV